MWALKTILYFCLFWAGCIMSLVDPIWGVVNYMLTYQVHPPVKWWGVPLVDMGMRFSLFSAFFIVLGLFLARHRVPDCKPGFSRWEAGVVMLLAIAGLNTFIGVEYGYQARFAFEKFWKMQVFVFILARLATTRRNLHFVIWTIVVGCLYLGHDAFTAPPDAFLLGRLERFGGPDIATSSGASAYMASMLPIIGVAFLLATRWRWKAMAAISGALTFNAMVLCRTRSAFIGLVVGGVAAALMAPRSRRFRIYALLFIGGVMAYSLTDDHFRTRMLTLTSRETLAKDEAAMSRVDIWKASYLMLQAHPWGVGLGNFTRMIGTYDPLSRKRSPHNTVVMCFCELGLLGGMVFLAMVFESVRLLYRSSRMADLTDNPLETKLMVYGFLISLVTYFVAGLGTERFSCESFWWILVLPLCLHRMVVREVEARADVTSREPLPALIGNQSWPGKVGYGF